MFPIQRLTNAARSNSRPLLIRQTGSDFVAEGELEARVARVDGLAADDATCVSDRSPMGRSQFRAPDTFKLEMDFRKVRMSFQFLYQWIDTQNYTSLQDYIYSYLYIT